MSRRANAEGREAFRQETERGSRGADLSRSRHRNARGSEGFRAGGEVGKIEMTRYFFHLTGAVEVLDEEGEMLLDDDQARRAALEGLAQTLLGHVAPLLSGMPYAVEAVDARGRRVCRIEVRAT